MNRKLLILIFVILSFVAIEKWSKSDITRLHFLANKEYAFSLPFSMDKAVTIKSGKGEAHNLLCFLSSPIRYTKSSLGKTDNLGEYFTDDTSKILKADKLNIEFKSLEIISYLKSKYF